MAEYKQNKIIIITLNSTSDEQKSLSKVFKRNIALPFTPDGFIVKSICMSSLTDTMINVYTIYTTLTDSEIGTICLGNTSNPNTYFSNDNKKITTSGNFEFSIRQPYSSESNPVNSICDSTFDETIILTLEFIKK